MIGLVRHPRMRVRILMEKGVELIRRAEEVGKRSKV